MPRAEDANPFLKQRKELKDLVTLDLVLRKGGADAALRFLARRADLTASPEAETALAAAYLAAREEAGRDAPEAKGLFEALNVLAAARAEGAETMAERLRDAKTRRRRRLHPAVDRFVDDHYARNSPTLCAHFERAPETTRRMWYLGAAAAALLAVNLALFMLGTRPALEAATLAAAEERARDAMIGQ